jgi:hypothetical protein
MMEQATPSPEPWATPRRAIIDDDAAGAQHTSVCVVVVAAIGIQVSGSSEAAREACPLSAGRSREELRQLATVALHASLARDRRQAVSANWVQSQD